MRKIYFSCLVAILATAAFSTLAQSQNVGIGTASPEQSAVLDIQSSNKGLLIPRMTQDQRNEIVMPVDGLLIYQTNSKSGFYFYEKNSWKPISDTEAKSVAGTDGDWTTTGNLGMSSGNYIGNIDNAPFNIRINNERAGFIDAAGGAGKYNLFLGARSGLSDFYGTNTGLANVGLGTETLKDLTTGSSNLGVGAFAAQKTTSGTLNVAVGANSLTDNTSGSNNLGFGGGSLRLNTTGDGNIAIGKFSLYSNLSGSGNIAIGAEAGYFETASNKLYIANSNTTTPLIYGDFSAKYVTIGDVTPALRSQGVATGGYNLLVKGGILTEKVKVALAQTGTDWADYVFEPSYKLMSLEEVESFTKANKHLPNVPSADEMVNSGLDVAQTSKMFMEKIEELTLYMIELNKEVKALKAENAALKSAVNE